MALQIVCASCGSKVSVRNDIHLEEKLRCPKCDSVIAPTAHHAASGPWLKTTSLSSLLAVFGGGAAISLVMIAVLGWLLDSNASEDQTIASNNSGSPAVRSTQPETILADDGRDSLEADSLGPGNASSIAQHNADDNHPNSRDESIAPSEQLAELTPVEPEANGITPYILGTDKQFRGRVIYLGYLPEHREALEELLNSPDSKILPPDAIRRSLAGIDNGVKRVVGELDLEPDKNGNFNLPNDSAAGEVVLKISQAVRTIPYDNPYPNIPLLPAAEVLIQSHNKGKNTPELDYCLVLVQFLSMVMSGGSR